MRLRNVLFLGLMALVAASTSARADLHETFDSAPSFSGDPFWLNNSKLNGYVVPNTSVPALVGAFGGEITHDVGGSGNFLFNGTAGDGPPGDRFYISSSFAVFANTNYNVSFYLTSANGVNSPSVQADIDSTLLGAPVTPAGNFATKGWQKFSFTWNSGSNTSAILTLHDYNLGGTGNDFGTDNIQVAAAAPEPSTFVVAILGALGMIGYSRIRRKAKN